MSASTASMRRSKVVAEAMAWAEKRQAEIEDAARADARRWFADNGTDSIPDLEFDTPRCSICDEHTSVEDDIFWCDICGVRWALSGRFGEAEPDHPMRECGSTSAP